jgi:hypothetical protein
VNSSARASILEANVCQVEVVCWNVSAKSSKKHSLPFVVRTICALFQKNIRAPIVGPALGHLLFAERKELLSAPQLFCGRVGQVCLELAI